MNKKFMIYKKGFSLVEVMITLLIFSIVAVAIAPVITKKLALKSKDGIVYTYKQNNALKHGSNDVCYVTNTNDFTANETLATGGAECNQYVFTVPTGVHSVNLTLVAGGGGGGGASGGILHEVTKDTKSLDNSNFFYTDITDRFIPDILKWVRINYMLIAGEKGYAGGKNTTANDKICSRNDDYCAGKGGSTHWGIVNFELPKYMMRGANYTNALDYTNKDAQHGLLRFSTVDSICEGVYGRDCQASMAIYFGDHSTNAKEADMNIAQKISYQVSRNYANTQPDNERLLGCYFSGHLVYELDDNGNPKLDGKGEPIVKAAQPNDYYYSTDSKSNFSVCGLKEENMIRPVEGEFGQLALRNTANSFYVIHDQLLSGGLGGIIPGAPLGYGNGGKGQTVKTVCSPPYAGTNPTRCKKDAVSTLNADFGFENDIGKSYISVSYAIEYPAVTGGGGSAGSVARIMNFKVTPGEKYYVYVGRGGMGGFQGTTSSNPTNGTNGFGGSSTAIFNQQGQLIYLVTGGVGGQGGVVKDRQDIINNANYGRGMKIAKSARSMPKLIYNNSIEDVILDSNMMTASNKNASVTISGNKTISLIYPVFSQEPYKTMRTGLSGETTSSEDSRSAGFSGFRQSIKGEYTENVGSGIQNVYDGFYFRTLIGNDAGYIGGLGGHSGLGGRAGCGGYFMGNFDGRRTVSAGTENLANKRALTNKFVLDGRAYDTFAYYGNCNNKTPDGQTAEFILPDPVASTYGQAGAGGGGGGWSSVDSSGKGGDGQDGYVMIEWQK